MTLINCTDGADLDRILEGAEGRSDNFPVGSTCGAPGAREIGARAIQLTPIDEVPLCTGRPAEAVLGREFTQLFHDVDRATAPRAGYGDES